MKMFLDPDQIKEFYILAGKRSLRDECLLRVMGNTGFRISDARTLLITDVCSTSFEVYTSIRKKMKKTGVYITRDINDSTRNTIKQYLPQVIGISSYLFPGADPSNPLSRTMCHYIFKELLEKLAPKDTDIKSSSTHTLRRSVGFLISENTNIETAAEFLGHRSVASTMAYLSKEKLKRQADDFLKNRLNF